MKKDERIVNILLILLYLPAIIALISGIRFFQIFTLMYWSAVLCLSVLGKGRRYVNEIIFMFILLFIAISFRHNGDWIGTIFKVLSFIYISVSMISVIYLYVKKRKDSRFTVKIIDADNLLT